MKIKKIAVTVPSLAKGGLERVAVQEAKELEKFYDVTLVVMDSFRVDYPFEGKKVELSVDLENRNILSRAYNLLKAAFKLRRLVVQEKFDLMISHGELSTLPNVLSIDCDMLAVVHENRYAALKDFQGRLVNGILKYLLSSSKVKKVVTVSEGIRDTLVERLDIDGEKIKTIYNPYDIEKIGAMAKARGEISSIFEGLPLLLTVGRLTMQKGQWYLIRIFAELKRRNPELKLMILGIGELKERLVKLSRELGLNVYEWDKGEKIDLAYDIYFMGFMSNPFEYISVSKLFVMSSLWEGFGNTIVESMACGVPVLTSDCRSGPGEIVAPSFKKRGLEADDVYDEEYGVLMPVFENSFVDAHSRMSEKELLWVDTIEKLLLDEERLNRLRSKGFERANDFSKDIIVSEWKSLIEEVSV